MRLSIIVLVIFGALLLFQQRLCAASAVKTGAVAFRFDDNKGASELKRLNAVFKKHNAPISYAINISSLIGNEGSIAEIKEMIKNGAEIMDHSPSHSSMRITFRTEAEAEEVKADPGVAYVEGRTAFLKCQFNDKYRHNKPLTVTVKDNKLQTPSEAVKKALRNQNFLVFPDGVVYGVQLKDDVYELRTAYNTPVTVPDAKNISVIRTDRHGLQPTDGAARLLVKTSLAGFRKVGFPRPSTFITPGGWGISPSGDLLRRIHGEEFGYTVGDSYNCWSGTYSRPNPQKERFRMSANWSSLELLDVEASKKLIADLVAKHRVTVFISHLWYKKVPGGLDELLRRNDQLLAWLRAKNIPVLTMAECAKLLYDRSADPKFNIMPSLDVDLDEDGCPDGYELDKSTKVTGNALQRQSGGKVFSVRKLSGIEAGANIFSFKASAPEEAVITVKLGVYNDSNSGRVANWLPQMRFTVKGSDMSASKTFDVPQWCPAIDIVCSAEGAVTIQDLSISQ